jgi:hypothetical protein
MVMAAKRYGSNPSMFCATPAAAYATGSTANALELRDVFQVITRAFGAAGKRTCVSQWTWSVLIGSGHHGNAVMSPDCRMALLFAIMCRQTVDSQPPAHWMGMNTPGK